MKTGSHSIAVLAATFAAGSPAYGAVVYNFDSESSGDLFAGEVAGWTQDSVNPSAFGQTFPLAYIATTNFGSGGTNSGHLGTQVGNTADNSTTTVTGTLAVNNVQSVTLNLAILDNNADGFAGRDAFSVSVATVGSSPVAQIGFTPTVGDDTLWDISLGVNGSAASVTLATIQALSGYVFQMDFSPTATTFLYGAQGGAANIVIGTRPAVSSFDLGIIEMTHTPLAPVGSSANTLVFDNITTTIPEPSTSILVALGLCVVIRRRR